jgi:catechol 2,3-dioxygenase-like lactoylglutathione lyase family enzyme
VIERTAEQLRAQGVEPRIRQDRPELYFTDPDGITVQLSGKEYRG